MRNRRFAFTLIELIAVMGIIGILSIIALPKFTETVRNAKVRSARDEVVAYFMRAHAVAIQRGQRTHVRVAGDRMSVVTEASGVEQTVLASDLYEGHGVSLSSSQSEFTYDPRGFAQNIPGAGRLVVTRDSRSMPVCVTGLGKAYLNGCN
jgi:prepilin-type N-terminal cleavage/methylation domain-containing protein